MSTGIDLKRKPEVGSTVIIEVCPGIWEAVFPAIAALAFKVPFSNPFRKPVNIKPEQS